MTSKFGLATVSSMTSKFGSSVKSKFGNSITSFAENQGMKIDPRLKEGAKNFIKYAKENPENAAGTAAVGLGAAALLGTAVAMGRPK